MYSGQSFSSSSRYLGQSQDDSDSDKGRSFESSTSRGSESGSSSNLGSYSGQIGLKSDHFDFAYRVGFLGDANSGKRKLAHNLMYGSKISKDINRQDTVLEQMSG
jgi:hypothetical protein